MAEIRKVDPRVKQPVKEPVKTPISTATNVFSPTKSNNYVGNTSGIVTPYNTQFQSEIYNSTTQAEQELLKFCTENPNSPQCIEESCRKNPFSEKCRPELTSGQGAGTFNTLTGVSTLETNNNIDFCLRNPNSPQCKDLYNDGLINTLDGGLDNIYATSLETPTDCQTPTGLNLNDCEAKHPRPIYDTMDQGKINDPMPTQAPLNQQVGVSNLQENPITETKVNPLPTLSMYTPETDCDTMLNVENRLKNNLPKEKPKRNFGGDLNQISKASSGNFFRARNPLGNGLDIYQRSFTNPLEYL